MKDKITKLIREKRNQNNLQLKEVAEQIGCDQRVLRQFEYGHNHNSKFFRPYLVAIGFSKKDSVKIFTGKLDNLES